MDNPESLPQLQTPSVPDDFNGGVGVPFARSLMLLLSGSTITNNDQSGAQPIDLSQIQEKLDALTLIVNNSFRKQRKIVVNGVDNAEMPVTFPDIGTTNYEVTVAIMIPTTTDPGTCGVYPIIGSFTTSQLRIRCDGTLSSYQLLVVVTSIYETDIAA